MMNYRQGEIVLVEFIFSEGTSSKKRPALIFSANAYHAARQEIIIMAITSNVERVLMGDTAIEQWKQAGLKFPSLVAGIFQTIKKKMIIKKLGVLSADDFQRVRQNVEKIFALHA